MKLIEFEAFGYRLENSLQEWPNEPPVIYMALAKSLDTMSTEALSTLNPTKLIKGKFVHSGKYRVLENRNTVAVYKLESVG